MKTHRIGLLNVYNNQVSAGAELFSALTQKSAPLLIAQPQQGKTGAIMYCIDLWVTARKENHEKYKVYYLINIADNQIRHQVVLKYVNQTKLTDIEVLHHAEIEKIDFKQGLDRVLLIVDESHWALLRDRPFHQKLKSIGVNYGEHPSTWKNRKIDIISVSATPYAHIIKEHIDSATFAPVTLGLPAVYYSLQQLVADKRLFSAEPCVDKTGNVTSFFKQRIKEFKKRSKSREQKTGGEAGYMVCRLRGKGPAAVKQYLSKNHPEISVMEFNCTKRNISDVDSTLNEPTARPTVVIILGSLRAGKTLRSTQYIDMWIEAPNSKADTTIQAIGRCLGMYKMGEDFPIYCNTSEINDAIEFYDTYNCVPSGVRNKSTIEKRTGRNWEFMPFDKPPTDTEVRQAIKKAGAKHTKKKLNKGPMKISDITSDNTLRELLRGRARHTDNSNTCVTYHIDGYKEAVRKHGKNPDKKKWLAGLKESYANAKKTKKDWLNKYILCVPLQGQGRIRKNQEDCLDPKTLFASTRP